MDMFFDHLGATIGLPGDQLKMVCALLISIPMGFGYKKIECNKQRTYIGLISGLIMSYIIYGEGIISVVIQNIIVYELTKRISLKGPISPRLIMIETLLFVSFHHIYRQYTDYGGWKLDVTTILMMNTVKWTSFAYCYYDGLRKTEDLNADQQERKISKLPGYIDYFGYMFFFFGCIAGPSYDYYDYEIFINRKGVYAKIPSTVKETLRLLRNGLIYSFMIAVIYPQISLDTLLTEEYRNTNFFLQTLWFNLSITLLRTKYVAGWLLSEAGLAAAGFTYNGENNNEAKWLRIRQIDPILDIKTNPKDKIEYWNMSVQVWLRRYVYLRTFSEKELKESSSKQSKAQLITFMVSAFWHGFYPSYYVAFFHWNLIGSINKYLYKLGQNTNYLKIWDSNIVFKFIRFYWVNSLFNYYGVCFQVLSLGSILTFNNATFWIFNISTYSVLLFFTVTGFGQKKKKIE